MKNDYSFPQCHMRDGSFCDLSELFVGTMVQHEPRLSKPYLSKLHWRGDLIELLATGFVVANA